MEIVLSLADKREAIAEAQRLYAEAEAYDSVQYEGYCFHGMWVGGCGIDWMCGACESDELGSSHYDYLRGSYRYSEALRTIKSNLLKKQVADWVADNSAKGLSYPEISELANSELTKFEAFLARKLSWELMAESL